MRAIRTAVEHLEARQLFSWIGATSGSTNDAAHNYNNLSNWTLLIINDDFSSANLTANTTIYLNANHTTFGNLNLGYSGNFDLTFESNGTTARTLTIAGGITGDFGGAANHRTVTIGNATNPVNVDMNAGTTDFNVNAGDRLVLQNTLTDGRLSKTGAGTLDLDAADNYTGGTTLAAGTIDLNNASGLGTGAFAIDSGTTIDSTSGGPITLSTNNAQNWNGAFTFGGSNALNLGTGAVTLGANVTVTTAASTLTVGGNIGDSGLGHSITKGGLGTLALGGASSYSGGTVVTAGLLQVYNGSGSTSSTFPTTLGNTSSPATVNAGATIWLDYLLGATSNIVSYANPFGGAGTLKVTAPGIGAGTAGLTGNLGGFTGTMDLFPSSGSLGKTVLYDPTNGSQPSAAATIIVENGTTLFLEEPLTYQSHILLYGMGNSESLGALRIEGSAIVAGTITLMSNSSIGAQFGTGTISGTISDGGNGYSLTKVGTNTVTLSGSNTYSGGTTLSAGQLNINNPAAIGTGTFTISGGTIDNTSGSPIALSTNDPQIWSGSFTFGGSNDLNLGAGTVAMPASQTVTVTNGNLTVGGNIAGGSRTLAVGGAGRLILSGNNTLGSVSIGGQAAGTSIVRAASNGALGSGIVVLNGAGTNGNLELSGGITVANPITFWGRGTDAVGIESVNGSNTLSGALSFNTGGGLYVVQSDSGAGLSLSSGTLLATVPGGPRIITLQGAGNGTISGSIGNGSGTVSINDLSTGSWTLSGANTYSGGTTVNSGTLDIDNSSGSGAGLGAVTVNSGSVLGGTGTLAGTVTVNSGGTIRPGVAGTSIFSTGSLTIAPGGNFDAVVNGDTAGTTFDQINVTGTVNITGSNVNLSGTRSAQGEDAIRLIQNDGSDPVVGTFNGFSEGAVVAFNGVPYTMSYQGGDGNDVVLTDASPVIAAPAVISPSTVTGTTANLSALGGSSAGENTLSYTWSVSAQPVGSQPIFSVNDSNAAKNSIVTFNQAGNYTLQVTIDDGRGTSVTSSVNVAVDQTFASITVSPANLSLTVSGVQPFTAVALDQFGRSMQAQPAFTWNCNAGSIDSTGLFSAPASPAGVTVSATSGGVTGSTNLAVVPNGTAAALPSIVTGTTTTLSVLGPPTSGITYTWSILAKPTGAADPTYSINASTASQSTTAIFHGDGSYTFQVIIDTGSGTTTQTVSVPVDQMLTGIVVSPASVSLNENGQNQFSASSFDQFGNPMTSPPMLTWALQSGLGSVDASGLYTAPGSGGSGSTVVSASSGSVSGSANITVINAAPSVAVAAAATPASVYGTSTVLTTLGTDDGGEANLSYSWTLTGTPPAAVIFSANGNNAAKNTTATFTQAGTYDFLVTITDALGLSVTSSTAITVNQTVTSLTVTPPSFTVDLGTQQQLSAAAFDQFGNAMVTAPSLNWAIQSGPGTINTSGLYTAGLTPGSATIAVTSGSASATANLAIINMSPTVAVAAAGTLNSAATAADLSVLGTDDGGEPNLSYTWATIGNTPATVSFSSSGNNVAKNTTVTFTQPGAYNFLVTITDAFGLSTSSAVSVMVNQVVSSLTLTPTLASIDQGTQQQLSSAALDQFGNLMISPPRLDWSVVSGGGSISNSGLYTAGSTAGTTTITVATGSVSRSAIVNVYNLAPVIAIAPAVSTNPVITTSTLLSVLGADDGPEANLTYMWAVAGAPPAAVNFSSNGTNAAKNVTATFSKAGVYNFVVRITDSEGAAIAAHVTAQVVPTLSKIDVTSASTQVEPGATAQFSAVAYDQFGKRLSAQPDFTWSTDGNSGSIDASGLYTAPSSGAAPATITATSGNVSGSTSIQLLAHAPPPEVFPAIPMTPGNPSAISILDVISNTTTTTIDNDSATTTVPSPPVDPNSLVEINATVPSGSIAPAALPAPAKTTAMAKPSANLNIPAPAQNGAAVAHVQGIPAVAPDQAVATVPEQVFPCLAQQNPTWKDMDQAKDQMTSETQLKIAAGAATATSVGVSAAYLIWLIRGGSLLSSLLSLFPAWKTMDPLPVLESFENSRKSRRRRKEVDKESLESLVDDADKPLGRIEPESTPTVTKKAA